MEVLHHERKRLEGHFSLERLYAAVRAHLPEGIEAHSVPCPFPSQGVLPRVRNVIHAGSQHGDVHHVVGDVHYLVLGLPAKRTVLTIHDTAALDRLRGLRRVILRHFWFRAPARRAAVVTTISAFSRGEIRRHLGSSADRIRIIPDCVPPDFRFVPKAFDSSRPVCLQVGTKWNKNLGRVTAALRGTPCRLDVVGRVSDRQRAELKAAGVDWRELGVPDDDGMRAAYEGCDFVLFASLYEGFGMPVLEAQAVGRPVITSKCGPMPEAAGEGALLVDPTDAEEMHSAVKKLIRDASLREGLVARGVENVRRFQPSVVALHYAEVYRELGPQT